MQYPRNLDYTICFKNPSNGCQVNFVLQIRHSSYCQGVIEIRIIGKNCRLKWICTFDWFSEQNFHWKILPHTRRLLKMFQKEQQCFFDMTLILVSTPKRPQSFCLCYVRNIFLHNMYQKTFNSITLFGYLCSNGDVKIEQETTF